ncbi:major facilitator superfamily domain-containing protein [Truncatella angustata]|uniref:Major facilitator superfamily domain-containing protein n=1 Tax=Truncatella angustata TaxID=152316 RepID=A0A9P8ZU11_9PEZI|nr:major facilitator superfamily domain-containing protein [Truncatella angustata]KAH6648861.1 major facilitator superfamily domain-containing protein [Truncatella angustata]
MRFRTQFVFSLFFGQAVSHLKSFGLNPLEIAVTLLSGPICGAVFQPYFGGWSDQCRSSWGRRKPFILIGTVALVFSMLCLAWADSIVNLSTQAFLPRNTSNGVIEATLAIISMLLTFIIFVAIQAIQVGLRALITDNCTPIQQAEANTWAGRHINFAGVLAYLAAYLDLPRHINGIGKTVFAHTSILTIVYLTMTITITCWYSTEKQYAAPTSNRIRHSASFRMLRSLSLGPYTQVRTICVVQFFSWLGWFPLLFYTVTYVTSLQGSHTAEYGDMGALAPLVHSIISLIVAGLLPNRLSTGVSSSEINSAVWLNSRNIWIASNCIFAISMLSTFFVTSAFGTVLLFSIVGVSWAVTSRVPYTLLAEELSRPSTHWNKEDLSDSKGLIYGIHNLAICLPQILVMCTMGMVWAVTETQDGSLGIVWFLRLGGVSTMLAAYFATKLVETV